MTDEAWTPTTAQLELIHEDHTRLVEACPGAGKTRAIVARYQRLATYDRRSGIGLLSFTNAAIDEVRRRSNDSRAFRSPNFVGTFDTFINRFITGPAMAARLGRYPRFIDSWRSIPTASFSAGNLAVGLEFSLDHFDWDENDEYRFIPQRATGPFGNALRNAYDEDPQQVDDAARQLRRSLVNEHLIVPCSESRHIARRGVLDHEGRRQAAECVLGRFEELIVDEAQDCGPEELAVLKAALAVGARVVAVADLDQAIFEFRRAKPEEILEFGDEIGRGARLNGNFRSSPAIVVVGERLRASDELDEAIGQEASNEREVAIFPFEDDAEVADIVRGHLGESGIDPSQSVLLAHRADDAASCAGAESGRVASRRAVVVFADAALTIATDDDPFRRRQKLADVERSLLRAAGVETGRTVDEDVEQLGLSTRWIRDAAIRVVFGADPRTGDRVEYTAGIREIVRALPWPDGTVISNHKLATPPESDWLALGIDAPAESAPLPWMTIHGAKGREFDAVALVIPRVVRADEFGLTCLDHWEQGSDSESRRVLYVGTTRAMKQLMIAVHTEHYERVLALLT